MSMTRRTLLTASAGLSALPKMEASPKPTPTSTVSQEPSLRGATASLVADAMRSIGLDARAQSMSSEVRPLTSVGKTMIGPAVTTQWEPRGGAMEPGAIRRFVFEHIDRAAPGSVWVVASGTDELVSMFGDLIGLSLKRQNLVGAVTDSGCRDLSAMEDIGLPIFATGPVLYGPGEVIQPVAADVPVECGGVSVRPGDFIVADVDGVLVVPHEALGELAREKDRLLAEEGDVRRRIERGDSLADAYSL